MSYLIPPNSPKAIQAAAFGAEMTKACHARDIPLKELGRACGVGHTALDNYRRGLLLPRSSTAYLIADALSWPKLRTMIDEFRTYLCARVGCDTVFRNDGGNRKIYCSMMCRDIAGNLRMAKQRGLKRTGNVGKYRANQVQLLKSGLKIADARNALLQSAIDAMCNDCEPEGVCRTLACPLRSFSPLPYDERDGTGAPRTTHAIRVGVWTPARRQKHHDEMVRAHAEGRMPDPPGFTDAQRQKAAATMRTGEARRRTSIASKARWDRFRAERAAQAAQLADELGFRAKTRIGPKAAFTPHQIVRLRRARERYPAAVVAAAVGVDVGTLNRYVAS